MTLQRLVLDYRTGELVVRVLYSTEGSHGPNTKARARDVTVRAREGLQEALEALYVGGAEVVGTSGYTTREDVLCIISAPTPSGVHKKPPKRGRRERA
jgi:hypothetical protein